MDVLPKEEKKSSLWKFIRYAAIYIAVGIGLSIVTLFILSLFIGTGASKVGDYLLAIYFAPFIGFTGAIPVTIRMNRAINKAQQETKLLG